jgi:hypothetical protein
MDSYAVDNPAVPIAQPPVPLARYMDAGNFLLRDANFWPDFATSARKISELYQLHQGIAVDGVVAVDNKLVTYIFEALGPLNLPSYGETITAQNFSQRLEYYYLPPGTATTGDWWLKRKEFVGVVMSGLFGRVTSAGLGDYLKLAEWLGRGLDEKHLELYFKDSKLQAALGDRGLAGTQFAASAGNIGDYLMVVDTNTGFNKVNANIEREVSYRVSSPSLEASLFASLTITYTSKAAVRDGTPADKCIKVAKYDATYQSMTNGCYWNYLRVYVPAGSVLRESTGFTGEVVVGSENGKTVFASEVVVPPAKTVVLTLSYVLPYRLSIGKSYELAWQKQAGTDGLPYKVSLNFAGSTKEWSDKLVSDRRFVIIR